MHINELMADIERQIAQIESKNLDAIDQQMRLCQELLGMQRISHAYGDIDTYQALGALYDRLTAWLGHEAKKLSQGTA